MSYSHRNKAPAAGKSSCRGTSLALMVVMLTLMLCFVGVAIYSGLSAYLQEELQKTASTAAQVGATAFYDNSNPDGSPLKTSGYPAMAVQQTFQHLIAANPSLQNFNVTLVNGAPQVDSTQNTVTVSAQLSIPTAFLSFAGINTIGLQANGAAQYVQYVLNNPVNIDTQNGPLEQTVLLAYPLVDGPGPDLLIQVAPGSPLHGYMVEACSGNTCYDITGAAKVVPGSGMVMDKTINGQPQRVIYGNVYIDLQALGPAYSSGVKKASSLRFVDDNVPDRYNPATQALEVEMQPVNTVISSITIYHFSVACAVNPVICTLPAGLQTAP